MGNKIELPEEIKVVLHRLDDLTRRYVASIKPVITYDEAKAMNSLNKEISLAIRELEELQKEYFN